MRRIMVVPYDDNWLNEFEKIKNELLVVMADLVVSIEHVGSTSVPGLCAKPIIDIDIVIENGMFETIKGRMMKIGYDHVGDLGIVGREAFDYEGKTHLMQHHLYVCNNDSDELKRHIALRDYLRMNQRDRDTYSQVKIDMAQKYPNDIEKYINGKQAVILDIYQKAGLYI